MKISKKLLSITLILTILLCLFSFSVAAYAATPDTKTVNAYPGQTVEVVYSEDACYGVCGNFTYSNPELFSDKKIIEKGSAEVFDNNFIFSSSEKITPIIKISVTVKSTATIGSTCVISFNVETREDVKHPYPDGPTDYTKTVTVKVVEKPAASSSAPSASSSSRPGTGSTSSNNTTSTKPTVTSKPSGTNKPATSSAPAVKLNLTELNKQISAAQQLDSTAYTADSWGNVNAALTAAVAARKATKQADVDTAAKKLADAIAALVKIDLTQLQNLLDSANDYLGKDGLSEARDGLSKAIASAQDALKSGKPDQIGSAYNSLAAALEAYKAKVEELSKQQIIEVEKPVEIDPHGPYCNIWLHRLWLVLLIISACINVVFIVLGVLYFVRRRQKMTSDDMTPADYTIDGE